MVQAVTDSSADGIMTLFINGVETVSTATVDNFDKFNTIDSVRLGAVTNIDAGTRGHLFLDELVVRSDDNEIGA